MGQAGAKVTSVTGPKSLILFSGRDERYEMIASPADREFGDGRPGGEWAQSPLPSWAVLAYCWLLIRAASNSSPFSQPMSLGKLAASQPSANPKRAMAESPTKSISG